MDDLVSRFLHPRSTAQECVECVMYVSRGEREARVLNELSYLGSWSHELVGWMKRLLGEAELLPPVDGWPGAGRET